MQLKEALIDSDRLDLDRLYVEKAIRDSEEVGLGFYFLLFVLMKYFC
jgi:hypothetical protein